MPNVEPLLVIKRAFLQPNLGVADPKRPTQKWLSVDHTLVQAIQKHFKLKLYSWKFHLERCMKRNIS